jgi:regulator of protease activity HflC (stomatin/prohibitin superfamily)
METYTLLLSIVILIGIIGILFLSGVLFIVEQQTVSIIERFGKFIGLAKPGLNIKLPHPISVVAQKASLRITQSDHELGIKTKDNAFIKLPVITQLKVIEDKVVESFYKLDDPINQINSFILNIIRSKAATLDLEDIYTKKDEIAQYVTESLHSKIEEYGYEIIDILVDEPEPSPEVKEAYNNVIASQRELDASRNQAEAKKILLVGEAEAEARSLELKAESYAVQRKVISKGLSEALDQLKTKDIDPHYVLEFIAGIDYRDALRDVAKSDSNTLIFSNNPKDDLQKLLPSLLNSNVSNKDNDLITDKLDKGSSADSVEKDNPWEQ